MTNQLISILYHPDEWVSLYKIRKKYKAYRADGRSLQQLANVLTDIDFCYAALSKVSRSFSIVIRRLPDDLRDAICIFYLVLRALDSIEDDTNQEKELRQKILLEFYSYLSDPNWKISGIGTNSDYRTLLENFPKISSCFRRLDKKYQQIILRVCEEMGEGMTLYLDKELTTIHEYDEYCYYVAGLVGVGLSELFVLSGLENAHLTEHKGLQISMGQFLQKTNIIRDFREDIDEGRTFWPREIWKCYAGELYDLTQYDSQKAAHCLNHMITDALALVPNCLHYLNKIKDTRIFQFCAIPQVMAISTLAEIFNNPDVFNKNIKIRKGLAAKLFIKTKEFNDVLTVFHNMAETMFSKISLHDPNTEMQISILQKTLAGSRSYSIDKNGRKSRVEDIHAKTINIHSM